MMRLEVRKWGRVPASTEPQGPRGGERAGSAPLSPVPGPKACVRAGGRPNPVSTEPPQAAGGHRAEGWATGLVNPAGAVAISRW